MTPQVFIVLIAADEQAHMPVLDGKPIPVILALSGRVSPKAWLENVLRGVSSCHVDGTVDTIRW